MQPNSTKFALIIKDFFMRALFVLLAVVSMTAFLLHRLLNIRIVLAIIPFRIMVIFKPLFLPERSNMV
jgi:hypothetical protein